MSKTLLQTLLLLLFSAALHAQHKAAYFAKWTPGGRFYVETKITHSCGDNSDLKFTITNRSDFTLDIKVFSEKKDGTWKMLGDETKFTPGAKTTDEKKLSNCSATGRWIVYFRNSGADDEFPTEEQVKEAFQG